MNISKLSEGQTVNWKHFPVINALLNYLDRKDFVELSKCNKFYRKQLEHKVFEKLKLGYWYYNISEIYEGLDETRKVEKNLELLKSDLGPKLKLIQSVYLDCVISKTFAETLAKLLPNIKTLRFDGSCDCDCDSDLGCDCKVDWQEGLITVLSCMDHLEHFEIKYDTLPIIGISTKNKIFPKSLKSLSIYFDNIYEQIAGESMYFYDTIDSTYINLQSITILSNTMLKNLSSGLPNLQNVKIKIMDLDESKFIKFIIANPQLRKINTNLNYYNEEIINTVLSSENLEHWYIDGYFLMDTEINNLLSSNHSIKHLKSSYHLPAPIALKIINACKGLETLDLTRCNILPNSLEWSKFERRVNILNLPYDIHTPNHIKDIDALRLFKSIYIERKYDLGDLIIRIFFEQMNSIKLNNYNITITTKSFILELINKTN